MLLSAITGVRNASVSTLTLASVTSIFVDPVTLEVHLTLAFTHWKREAVGREKVSVVGPDHNQRLCLSHPSHTYLTPYTHTPIHPYTHTSIRSSLALLSKNPSQDTCGPPRTHIETLFTISRTTSSQSPTVPSASSRTPKTQLL